MEDDTFSNEAALKQCLTDLQKLYVPKRSKKAFLHFLAVTQGDVSINLSDIDEDFNRELKLYGNALDNSKSAIEKLIQLNVPVWRPKDYKAEMYKSESQMKKIEKHVEDIKKRMEVVEKRRGVKNSKKFSNEAHKRHVRAKQLRMGEQKAKRQKATKDKSARFIKKKKSFTGNKNK